MKSEVTYKGIKYGPHGSLGECHKCRRDFWANYFTRLCRECDKTYGFNEYEANKDYHGLKNKYLWELKDNKLE